MPLGRADGSGGGLRDRLAAWRAGKEGNIRALLGSLHTVLWPGAPWAPASLADLVDPAAVRRAYRRAALVVHPDKVASRGGAPAEVAVADAVFDALKGAWAAFEAGDRK